MIVETFQKYRLGLARSLSPHARQQLLELLGTPASAATDPLNGRAQAQFLTLPSLGSIVVKHYMRGGLMRYVSRRRHLRRRSCRGELEFRMLKSLHEAGLPVPKPLGWAESGRLFAKTWLFLAEIPRAKTLAQLDQSDPTQSLELIPKIHALIDRLIELNIHHVDLHPGNVLVDEQNDVYLIDFDKAAHVTYSPSDLRQRHFRRWNRAIAKHQLSPKLGLSLNQIPQTTKPTSSLRSDAIIRSTSIATWLEPVFFGPIF